MYDDAVCMYVCACVYMCVVVLIRKKPTVSNVSL